MLRLKKKQGKKRRNYSRNGTESLFQARMSREEASKVSAILLSSGMTRREFILKYIDEENPLKSQ